MFPSDTELSETDIRSPDAEMWTVRASPTDPRPWMTVAPLCPALESYGIAHLGVAKMPAPFEIVRTKLGGTYFLSCSAGRGRVFVNGRWEACSKGQAFLLSPGTLHAFRADPHQTWEFTWVRYAAADVAELADANSPLLADFEPEPVRHAVLGLHHAAREGRFPAAITGWIEMVQRYVEHFAGPVALDPRLVRVWAQVAADLSHRWSSEELASIAHLSEKQLERLCRKQLGRTPRQQLISLRIREAARLLSTTDQTIETIASAVGYTNPFTFSTTFRRLTGWSPSRYPGRL